MATKSASPASDQILSEIGLINLPDDWTGVRIEELLCNDRGISVGVMYPGDHDPLGIPLIKAGDLVADALAGDLALKLGAGRSLVRSSREANP